jgi:predicted flap endonuclease-1-like 5' DNA nuclease
MPAVTAPRPSPDPAPYASSGFPPFRPARALGPPDDLKRIRGIGPATEKRLNEVGVSTWAQVAAFAPNEIPTIADIAKVSIDKIRPWIDQARALVANDADE